MTDRKTNQTINATKTSFTITNETELAAACKALQQFLGKRTILISQGVYVPPIEECAASFDDVRTLNGILRLKEYYPDFVALEDMTPEQRNAAYYRLRGSARRPDRFDNAPHVRPTQNQIMFAAWLEGKYFNRARVVATLGGGFEESRRAADVREKTGAVLASLTPPALVAFGIIPPAAAVLENACNRVYLLGFVKRNAPNCDTMRDIIAARFGESANDGE